MTSREATQLLPLPNPARVSTGLGRWKHRIFIGAVAAIQWPWLLRALYGGSQQQRAALLDRLSLPPDALPNLGSWKADCFFLHSMVDWIEIHRPQMVMELGAGATSLVAARALQLHGGGQLLSMDQHEDFARSTQDWVESHGLSAEIRHAPLGTPPGGWPGRWYETGPLPERIDLLLIDGPPWSEHPLVRGAAEQLFSRIPIGGGVLLDDAARPGERMVVRRWKQLWPCFRFERPRGGTKGLVVGTRLG